MNTKKLLSGLVLFFSILYSCRLDIDPYRTETLIVQGEITKWYDDHAAAITLTYDHGNPTSEINRQVQALVLSKGLQIDYEIVTSYYDEHPEIVDYLVHTLVPQGFGYYGHGHLHVRQDDFCYDEVCASMTQCYRSMKKYGLQPVAYAYPASGGLKSSTRQALCDAGFLSGRLHFSPWMSDPLLIPGETTSPEDWYALPCLVMQDYKFAQCEPCINDNGELLPYLDDAIARSGWLILAYHSIGETLEYGFFEWDEFLKNLDAVRDRDFWNASMNDVTLYLHERERTDLEIQAHSSADGVDYLAMVLSDSLPDSVYNHALTVQFLVPEILRGKACSLVQDDEILRTIVMPQQRITLNLLPNEDEYRLIPL